MSHVLIAGGGIGGLVAALSLLRRGHQVTVCEQARELTEFGAGVQIAPNASRVLVSLGLEAALQDLVCVPTGKEIRLFDTGQTWKLADLGEQSVERYGAPYWLVHRGDLHSVLVAAVRAEAPESLLTGARVSGFEQDENGVKLDLEDGRQLTGDALIGCDGIHSVVRRILHGGDMAVTFVGRAAWRGVIPSERLSPHQRRLVGTNWIGPGANAVVYPLRQGKLVNFVGALNDVEWTSESWTAPGSPEELRSDFAGWHPDIQELIENIDVPLKWAFRGREPLTSWTKNRVTLLGDAAHPTLPTMAQGACMAIEDGAVLARCIDGDGDVAGGLQRYEAARLERTSRLVRASTDNTRRLQDDRLGGPGAVNFVDVEYQPDAVAKRYDWLFEYDALSVPA